MAVTFVAAATLGSVAADPPTFDLTLPALSANDIIIIAVMSKNIVEASNEIATPTDYTEVGTKTEVDSAVAADDMRTALFYKRAVSGDSGASVTISRAGTSALGLYAVASVWRGAVTSGDPFDTVGIVIGSSATAGDVITFPAIDPVATDVHVIYDGWKADDSTDALANFDNDSTTFTIRDDQETTTGSDCTHGIWSATRNGNPLAAVNATVNGTDGSYIGYSFALLPAGAATPVADTDSGTETEALTALTVGVTPSSETGTLTDTTAWTAAWQVVDSATVSDAALADAPVTPTGDSSTLSDALTALDAPTSATDTGTATDALTAQFVAWSPTDSVSLTDTPAPHADVSVADSITLGELGQAQEVGGVTNVQGTDSATLTDALTALAAATTALEAGTLTDLALIDATGTTDDTLGLTDAVSGLHFDVTVADSLTVSEAIATISLAAIASEAAALSDALAWTVDWTVGESATVTDTQTALLIPTAQFTGRLHARADAAPRMTGTVRRGVPV